MAGAILTADEICREYILAAWAFHMECPFPMQTGTKKMVKTDRCLSRVGISESPARLQMDAGGIKICLGFLAEKVIFLQIRKIQDGVLCHQY